MRACTRCGVEREESDFYAPKPGGRLHGWCKPCHRESALARYYAGGQQAKDAARERMRLRRQEDPEGVRERDAAYWKANPEKKAAKDRRYSQKNPEKRKSIVARWYRLNPERGREHGRNSAAAHKARKQDAFVERVEAAEVLRRHGPICGICGEPLNPQRFDVDHIIPLALGGEHSYANTQPAHPVCNQRKGARLVA